MDRRGYHRHRAVLSATAAGSVALLMLGGRCLVAQVPSSATPASTTAPATQAAATATPWVQAAPPPAASPARQTPGDKGPAAKSTALTPAASPFASSFKEDIARAMARKRQEELAKQGPAPLKPPRGEPQLSPEEREVYERNLGLWMAMSQEEKQAIRGLANERIREETEKAYQSSGLNLNDDQREVFALRYRQERRRLERELQEKARAERARRMPEIMERLKHEFPAAGTPKPTSAPTVAGTPPAPAKQDAK